MRHYVTSLSLFTILIIILLTMGSLTSSARMTAFLYKREADLAVQRGVSGIADAKQSILDKFNEEETYLAEKTFSELTKILYDNNISVSDEEANDIYRERFFCNLKKDIGSEWDNLADYLDECMPEVKHGDICVDRDAFPEFIRESDKIYLRNIPINYSYKNSYEKSETFDVCIDIPPIVLFDGNDEIFSYALVGGKGIYITGNTSTIMGNVFAGKHGPEEMRKSEALYAERDLYGGLNIMSTQVAIYGKKIVSEGDINLRGSFVLMGSEEEPIDIYTNNINQVDNLASKNLFSHVGNTYAVDEHSPERESVDIASEMFIEAEFYYDSDNDRFYKGTYRKIISAMDVTLKNDLTGIVIAPGNVIIEEGVNVEGLIICGDRIYIQGNNNIVSSKEVLQKIIKEELSGEIYEEVDVDDEMSEMSSLHMDVVDYLGGIEFRGY